MALLGSEGNLGASASSTNAESPRIKFSVTEVVTVDEHPYSEVHIPPGITGQVQETTNGKSSRH
jgi:hypothetical protein